METTEIQEMFAEYEACTDDFERVDHLFKISKYYFNLLTDNEAGIKYSLLALQKAEELSYDAKICDICNGLGVMYRRAESRDLANEYFQRAIAVSESLGDYVTHALANMNLGLLYYDEYNITVALEYINKGIKTAEQNGDERLRAISYSKVALVYMFIGKYEKAVENLRQSLKLLSSPTELTSIYYNIAQAYGGLDDYALAIGYYKKAAPLYKSVHHHSYLIDTYCNIADAYISLQKYDKVTKYLHLAKDYIAENNIIDRNIDTVICNAFINLYLHTGNSVEMEKCIEQFLALDVTDHIQLQSFYRYITEYYEKQGKYDLAYTYLQKLQAENAILLEDEMQKNMAIKTANYEYEREKQKNEELLRSHMIIEQKNEELLVMHAEKDNLMNTISHDLKNYLGSIRQALDIYSMKEKDVLENKYIKIIDTTTNRSLNLVKEILYSTKVSASADSLSFQTVDINNVIAEVEETLRLRGDKKQIKIIFEYATEPLMVQLDSEKWHRVFENLTTNAIKFTPTGNDIYITTRREGEYAWISIKDTGIGISPENIGKLFTPFSGVGRKGTDGEESTGLGLSIVKKLVELHGGVIEVSSEVGHGTEFVVKLKIVTV